MNVDEVRTKAFAMPFSNPSYPPGPYRFYGGGGPCLASTER